MRISDWSSDVCSSDLSDTFLLPERLLTLGLVWRWRENKNLDATGDQEAFIKALDEYAAKDKGSRVIRSRSRLSLPGPHIDWPYELGGLVLYARRQTRHKPSQPHNQNVDTPYTSRN